MPKSGLDSSNCTMPSSATSARTGSKRRGERSPTSSYSTSSRATCFAAPRECSRAIRVPSQRPSPGSRSRVRSRTVHRGANVSLHAIHAQRRHRRSGSVCGTLCVATGAMASECGGASRDHPPFRTVPSPQRLAWTALDARGTGVLGATRILVLRRSTFSLRLSPAGSPAHTAPPAARRSPPPPRTSSPDAP